jgi:hypothetical protein
MPLGANQRVDARHTVVCLDESQATRRCAYVLFDGTGVLHAFYQYLSRRCRRSCFDEIEGARLIKRDWVQGAVENASDRFARMSA